MKQRRVVILGATGSIGQSARKVARDIPERMQIAGMSAHSSAEALAAAGREFPGARLALSSGDGGEERLTELATLPEADMVLVAIVGTGGLRPALAAIEAGKDIAVASKEILVMAGEAMMAAARPTGVAVLPVDSSAMRSSCWTGGQERRTSNVQRSTRSTKRMRGPVYPTSTLNVGELNVLPVAERSPSPSIPASSSPPAAALHGPRRSWPM